MLSSKSLDRRRVEKLIASAEQLRGLPRRDLLSVLAGKVVATLFYEPSTRTRLSFEAAVVRLGGQVVSSENAKETSSAKKGERLSDVFRVVGAYADALVVRHHETGAIEGAADKSPVPIINAGSGSGEHPTQALLDAYTIWRELGGLDGRKICIMGDLKYGRTVHSLVQVLTLFDDIEVVLFHPESLALPEALTKHAQANGTVVRRAGTFAEAVHNADVIYQTRVQIERLQDADEAAEAGEYLLTKDHMNLVPEHARILHPLPRVNELALEVDDDPRAAYFRQVENGLYIRMALLKELIGGDVLADETAGRKFAQSC
ncbi:aspartate carbamoyltransferase [Alicyclobacillus sp. SO9]|uniref:aspartate carbamoyltransferase n=1 Tax=Alicyclobacillus sp. SO9 TaxID=2665646 RepID=UPI0018E8ACDB|nr:aspartate carbamoyltransferase [Alicyclobacillus sp. SO9]QQE81229.1 aspartate carbamoyltransferase [Alicyclobacillus sp. SO9]